MLSVAIRVLARAKSKGGGGGRDKRKSSIYNSPVDLFIAAFMFDMDNT